MLTSVIIPVYNRKDFIRQCLESVLQQDFKGDYEVIVVDDGSTDGTVEILKEFSTRIKSYLSEVNQGVSCVRNQGVRLSQGKIVAMIDSDCIAYPDWLSELIKPFEQDEDIMIVGGRVEDIAGNNYWQMVNKGLNAFIANSNGYTDRLIGCNMAIRREFVLSHPYDERLQFAAGDDTDLCWSCREMGLNVFYTHSARVIHHHRSTLKGSFVQQFLYGYTNTYLCIKFGRFPYVPYGPRLLLLLLLCILLGFLGFTGAWAAAAICWIMFLYVCWYHGTKALVKTRLEVVLTYPGNYFLHTVFCVGCLSYFFLPGKFLRKPDLDGNRKCRIGKTSPPQSSDKKIQVALISPFLPLPPVKGGGIERGIFEGIPHFKNTHFQVFSHIYGIERPVIVRGINAQYVQFPLNEKLYAWQNQWNYAIARKYHFSSFDFLLIRQVIRHLKQDPDIIEIRNNFFYIPLLRRRFPRSRFILKMHNEYFFAYPHLFKQYVNIIDSVDRIITNSHFLKNRIIQQYPKAERKIQVIHNAVALHRFKKLPDDDPGLLEFKRKLNITTPREKTFVFVGRIDPIKGVHILMDAFERVLARHPEARIIITGSTWFADCFRTPYLEKIRHKTLPWKHAVMFTGFIHHDELNYIYNLAGISVVPSVCQEGFGLVNLESMAAGCAVIATRVGGIPEIVTHEKTGLLVEPSNVHDLTEQMIYLLEHPEKREFLAANGRSYAQKHGDWDIVAQKTESIYQVILGNGR